MISTLIVTVTLTFDIVTPISLGVIYYPWPIHMWSIKPTGQSLMSYWSKTIFTLIVTVTLTLDLVIPISIGVIYCPRPIHMWSIKPIGHSVLKLLIRNELVYRQTDSPTNMQQYTPLISLKGCIKITITMMLEVNLF